MTIQMYMHMYIANVYLHLYNMFIIALSKLFSLSIHFLNTHTHTLTRARSSLSIIRVKFPRKLFALNLLEEVWECTEESRPYWRARCELFHLGKRKEKCWLVLLPWDATSLDSLGQNDLGTLALPGHDRKFCTDFSMQWMNKI